jgi:hypothetical protein
MEPSPPAILSILSFTFFLPQTYQTNQAPPLAYYQSYYYATTNHPQHPPAPQITYPPSPPQIAYPLVVSQITYPVQNNHPKSKMKPIHHPHLCHKPKNPSSKMKPSQLMAQSLELPEVPIPTLTPSDSAGTIIEN